MKKRFKMKPKASKQHFTKNAVKTHSFNSSESPRANPMRGGIRM